MTRWISAICVQAWDKIHGEYCYIRTSQKRKENEYKSQNIGRCEANFYFLGINPVIANENNITCTGPVKTFLLAVNYSQVRSHGTLIMSY